MEQWDTEELAALDAGGDAPAATNVDAASHVPPVLTRTWFHTGVYLGRDHVSDFFAGLLDASDAGEYYREPGLTDDQARALLLDDTVLPDGPDRRRGARGLPRAQGLDAAPGGLRPGRHRRRPAHPYTVTEQNFTVRASAAAAAATAHARVLHAPARGAQLPLRARRPRDPRVAHAR